MNLSVKVTVGLFLLVQALHLASLQNSTSSTAQKIPSSWLRKFSIAGDGSENTAVSAEEGNDHEAEGTEMESSNDYSGIASGSMAMYNEEEENVLRNDKNANYSDYMDVVATALPLNATAQQPEQPEVQNSTDIPVIATTNKTNSSNVNTTEVEEGFNNSTTVPPTHQSAGNTTNLPGVTSHTSVTTTLAPEVKTTQEPTTESKTTTRSMIPAESANPTTVTPNPTPFTETTHEPTTPSPTTTVNSRTTTVIPTTTAVAPTTTPEKGNDTDRGGASGSSSDRGLASDADTRRQSSWVAILGTAVAVICVGLVAYVILKNKHKKDFSHRKLVEDFPNNTVHRLDNNEPLDLNFGGSAYYNPGLQGDNIQMTNFPGRP